MKSIKFLIAVLSLFLMSHTAFSQGLMHSGTESMLSDEQKEEMEDAVSYIEKGEQSEERAEKVFSRYEDLLKSSKRRKRKKFERKTWEGKKYLIDAELKYQRAYGIAVETYNAFIQNADFYSNADETDAKKLANNASGLVDAADGDLDKIKSKARKKGDLKDYKYKKLKGDISSVHSKLEDAYSKITEALNIILKQADKKKFDEEDNRAWQTAKDENTIESYQEYINVFSNGKFVRQAQLKIDDLRDNTPAPAEDNVASESTGLTFKVQIAASKTPLTHTSLSRKHSELSEIERQHIGGQYKYRIGSFPTYPEAENYLQQVRRKVPGAFIVVFDENNNQIDVTEDMKNP